MTELKPCPFCGYRQFAVIEQEAGFHTARCHNCFSATCPAMSDEEARAFWNKRSEPKEE